MVTSSRSGCRRRKTRMPTRLAKPATAVMCPSNRGDSTIFTPTPMPKSCSANTTSATSSRDSCSWMVCPRAPSTPRVSALTLLEVLYTLCSWQLHRPLVFIWYQIPGTYINPTNLTTPKTVWHVRIEHPQLVAPFVSSNQGPRVRL